MIATILYVFGAILFASYEEKVRGCFSWWMPLIWPLIIGIVLVASIYEKASNLLARVNGDQKS